ncbi:MAG: endonuclease, partial [Candidatus Cloacimonetes bacterium]|nr:endonuclease [Candidatus Cloacimonadota bacterium]
IRPSDTSVNSARSNLDFDNGGNEYIDGDGPTGCHFDFNSWEPRPEVKGDVARMIFYMDVRYEGEYGEPDLEMVDWVNSAPENQPYHGKKSTLLSWHHEDPPDDWEMLRNDKIYSYQQNRNPFIDHPEFVERIWEDVATEDYLISSRKISLSNHPNPFNPETVITFAAPDMQETAQLVIFDLTGRKIVETNIDIHNSAEGNYRWNANKQNSGIYFYQVKISGFNTSTGKMILLK